MASTLPDHHTVLLRTVIYTAIPHMAFTSGTLHTVASRTVYTTILIVVLTSSILQTVLLLMIFHMTITMGTGSSALQIVTLQDVFPTITHWVLLSTAHRIVN